MASRVELQKMLEQILGTTNVYFQPPESVKMEYPAIIYEFDGYDCSYADDNLYKSKKKYRVTIVESNPESTINDKMVSKFSYCRFDRSYTADNLYHNSFTLFY